MKSLYIISAFLLLFLINTSEIIGCTGHDIIITNITITSVSNGDDYAYSYTIKNIGTTNIMLNEISLQNYVSTDNQVGGDAAAGGSIISSSNTEYLVPGASFTGTFGFYPFPQNTTSTHPYLIVYVYLYPTSECDATNNYYTMLIQITTPTLSAQKVEAKIQWSSENKNLSVEEWGGKNNTLQYYIYNLSGNLIQQGDIRLKQMILLSELTNGIYIIHFTDESSTYSTKIIY